MNKKTTKPSKDLSTAKTKKTEKKTAETLENLGVLGLKKTSKLFVGLLPTAYKAALVSYQEDQDRDEEDQDRDEYLLSGLGNNGIRVSCLLPAESHNIQIVKETYFNDYNDQAYEEDGIIKTVKHKSTPTLFTLVHPDFPNGATCGDVQVFSISAKHKTKIMAAPYEFPNVSDGYICFGNVGTPKDLRSAHALFWNSPFHGGGEHSDDSKSNVEYIRHYKSIVDHSYEDLTAGICGKKFWSTTQQADGIIITNNQELLRQIPEKFWLRNAHNEPFLIALADPTENDRWKFWSRGFSFEVDDKFISTPRSGNKKVTAVETKIKELEKALTKV